MIGVLVCADVVVDRQRLEGGERADQDMRRSSRSTSSCVLVLVTAGWPAVSAVKISTFRPAILSLCSSMNSLRPSSICLPPAASGTGPDGHEADLERFGRLHAVPPEPTLRELSSIEGCGNPPCSDLPEIHGLIHLILYFYQSSRMSLSFDRSQSPRSIWSRKSRLFRLFGTNILGGRMRFKHELSMKCDILRFWSILAAAEKCRDNGYTIF